jgi:hypothetical protein
MRFKAGERPQGGEGRSGGEMLARIFSLIIVLSIPFLYPGDPVSAARPIAGSYETTNLFVVVIDGIRDREGFGYDFGAGVNDHPYLPFCWNTLKPQGTTFMEMYNVFHTTTSPGHQTILTGEWQMFPNYGLQSYPHQTRAFSPTIFECARKELGTPKSMTWCVVGKLNCVETDWSVHPAYGESYGANMLVEPLEIVPQTDSLTVDALMEIIDADHPSLVLVNLKGVDEAGHRGTFREYLQSILYADRAVERIWERLTSDPYYLNNTTMILTTDHGRHDPGIGGPFKSGYRSHGGICHGCKHTFALVVGPDTPVDVEVSRRTYQVDIAPTVGELYGFETPFARGQVLTEAVTGYSEPDRLIRKQPSTDIFNGMVVVTWADNRSGNDEIYMVASTDNGLTFGDTIQVSQSGVAAIQPTVAADSIGLHIAWLDYRADDWGLYYRRSTDFGDTWDDERLIFNNVPETEMRATSLIMWDPHILAEADRIMVSVSGHRDWVGGAISQNGGLDWDLQVIDSESFFANQVNACSQPDNMALTWCDQTLELSGSANWEVYYKGVPIGNPQRRAAERISENSSYSVQPTIDSDMTLNLGIAWADNLPGPFQIFFRKSDDGGTTWQDSQTLTNSPVGAWQPDLAWNRATNDLYLIWTDYRDGQGEIYHSAYDGNDWSAETRLTVTTGTVNQPNFAIDEEGNTFLAWEVVTDSQTSIEAGNLISP